MIVFYICLCICVTIVVLQIIDFIGQLIRDIVFDGRVTFSDMERYNAQIVDLSKKIDQLIQKN